MGSGGRWARSAMYRILGSGLNRDGSRIVSPEKFAPAAKRGIQEFANACADHTSAKVLKVSARFPAPTPVTPFYALYPESRPPAPLDELEERRAGPIGLRGDFLLLRQRFAGLTLKDICELRNMTCFQEYRKHLHKVEDQGGDQKLKHEVAKLAVGCLAELGKRCKVSIEVSEAGPMALDWISRRGGSKWIATGLGVVGVVAGTMTGMVLLSVAGGIARSPLGEKGVLWLAMQMVPAPTPEDPMTVQVTYEGGIERTGSGKPPEEGAEPGDPDDTTRAG